MHVVRHVQHSCMNTHGMIDRVCLLISFTVLILAVSRYYTKDVHDPSHCGSLLNSGQWLDTNHKNWQPHGCMMTHYQGKDVATCLGDRRAVFVGDSATRQVFYAVAETFGIRDHVEDRHKDVSFSAEGATLEFIWDPFLNSSTLSKELTAASLSNEKELQSEKPAMLIIGGGLWYTRYLGQSYLDGYRDVLEQMGHTTSAAEEGQSNGSRSWLESPLVDSHSFVAFMPLDTPHYEKLTPARASNMTPERIDTLNMHLQHFSMQRQIPVLWSAIMMTRGQAGSYLDDGLHVIPQIAANRANVLMNLKCNAILRKAQDKTYPMDKTCCNHYSTPNWIQDCILNGSMGLLPLLVLITSRDSRRLSFLPSRKISRAMMQLALALCYCFYADRTQLFHKVQKQWHFKEFVSMSSVALIVGLLSLRQLAALPKKQPHPVKPGAIDSPFLSRHQTDEWKGWMQLIILIYHYTGASKVLCIYEIVRLLVASYLFMSGFGHTIFFYQRADYSLRRSAAVLVRLNMLSCVLPYVMETDYTFYYFAPLISFWYLVIYTTMAFGHSKNQNLTFLLSKLMVSALTVTAIIKLRFVFETLFYVLAKSCNIHWDVKEWRFRLQLDNYIVFIGMICGILFVQITDKPSSEDRTSSRLKTLISRNFQTLRLASVGIAIITPPVFFLFANKAQSKQVYNSWLPYVSAFPILSFVVLRNSHQRLRTIHSTICAWIGRHSLETFTLQFHIWLAADTKGLLALGIVERATSYEHDGRRVDMAILTIIFLYVCLHVAEATQTLTNWIIDPSEGREDIAIDQQVALPRIKSKDQLLDSSGLRSTAAGVGSGALQSASRIKRMVSGDLRVRLAIILGAMWTLNMIYPSRWS